MDKQIMEERILLGHPATSTYRVMCNGTSVQEPRQLSFIPKSGWKVLDAHTGFDKRRSIATMFASAHDRHQQQQPNDEL